MDKLETFMLGYWDGYKYYVIALAVIFLVTAFISRRPMKACTILLMGVYVTLAIHFLSVRESMGYTLDWALGIVIGFGLVLGALFYYLIFIRTE